MERAVEIVKNIYSLVAELERIFPGRRFTPDGHMVGGLGEVWAQSLYGLHLLKNSAELHDAHAEDGRLVQVKATQRNAVAMSGEPDHLIVLRLLPNGTVKEEYNGPGAPAWAVAGKMQKNGQRPLSLSKLRALMLTVPDDQKLPTVRPAAVVIAPT